MAVLAGPALDWAGAKAPQAEGVLVAASGIVVIVPVLGYTVRPAPDLAFDNPAATVVNPVGYAL